MRITPSVLNADLADLAGEVARIPSADAVHIDVMDNHFVPNLTLGLPVVSSLQRHTKLPFDIHLMIEDADSWAPQYAEAGCESVTFHAEATSAPVRLAREIRRLGSAASLALRPATPIEPFADLIAEFDQVLIMTVEPGFGGQKFLDIMLPKIRRTRAIAAASGVELAIQVDAPRRVRMSSWPGPPSSGQPIPTRWSPRCGRPRCRPPTATEWRPGCRWAGLFRGLG